jgi:hypothetical protein
MLKRERHLLIRTQTLKRDVWTADNVESETESNDAKRVTSLLIPHDNVSVPKRNSARVEGLVLLEEEGAGHSQCKCDDWPASLRPAHFLMQRDARAPGEARLTRLTSGANSLKPTVAAASRPKLLNTSGIAAHGVSV